VIKPYQQRFSKSPLVLIRIAFITFHYIENTYLGYDLIGKICKLAPL
jgi:hypothetical protein